MTWKLGLSSGLCVWFTGDFTKAKRRRDVFSEHLNPEPKTRRVLRLALEDSILSWRILGLKVPVLRFRLGPALTH